MSAEPMKCPECADGTLVLRSSRFGKFYGCTNYPACTAAHGAHPDGKPLGVPADRATKQARIRAHAAFDLLWQDALSLPCYAEARGDRKAERRILKAARSRAYRYLADALGVPFDDCHIGRFDIDTCVRAVSVCAGVTPATVRRWSEGKTPYEK